MWCVIPFTPSTTRYQDRLSVFDILRNGQERCFRLNGEALALLENVTLSKITRQVLQTWCSEDEMNEADFQQQLERYLPNLGQQTNAKRSPIPPPLQPIMLTLIAP